jgi:uncharacterized membrane protein YgaE (UPF0421/DUF939 family)
MAAPEDRLRRLERRIRLRLDVRVAAQRVLDSLPAMLQILAAVAIAYAIAHWGLGHAVPVLAVTVTISSLGFARDARPRRVAESILGIVLGVALSDALTLVFGTGLWQLLVVLFAAFVVARALSANPAFAVAAAIPSALVVLLPPSSGGPFGRTLDAVIAGVVALLVTALLPRDPGRGVRRERRVVYSVIGESFGGIVDGLRDADSPAAELALDRLRRTEPLLAAWNTSLDSALSVARISPFLRSRMPLLRREAIARETADLAVRHLRPLARRVEFLVRDLVPRPALAGLVAQIADGVRMSNDELDDPLVAGAARSVLADVTRRLDPAEALPGAGIADVAVLLQLRPLLVDLLVGTGMPIDEARALLPTIE